MWQFKVKAIIEIVQNWIYIYNIKNFIIKFPSVKEFLLDAVRNNELEVTTNQIMWNEGIISEFLEYCSENIRNKKRNKIFSEIHKICIKDTDLIKKHLVIKISQQLQPFEDFKVKQMKEFFEKIKNLLKSISHESISRPFWIENENLVFYYLRYPNGVFRKNNNSFSYSLAKYNICKKIPIISNISWIPAQFFNKVDKFVHFATCKDNKEFYLVEEFFSDENLKKANENDIQFLRAIGFYNCTNENKN